MAQYNETIYASDSWAENYANGELSGITRAASLTSQENFAFTYDNMPYFLYAASESWIRVRYPTTSQYQKKKAGAGPAVCICNRDVFFLLRQSQVRPVCIWVRRLYRGVI